MDDQVHVYSLTQTTSELEDHLPLQMYALSATLGTLLTVKMILAHEWLSEEMDCECQKKYEMTVILRVMMDVKVIDWLLKMAGFVKEVVTFQKMHDLHEYLAIFKMLIKANVYSNLWIRKQRHSKQQQLVLQVQE